MRLLVVSYQKSGTHQIMPMVNDLTVTMQQIIDETHKNLRCLPYKFGGNKPPDSFVASEETVIALQSFPHRAFGHITYFPEYAAATQVQPTKVLFNMRDPRDVIVAEFENMRRKREAGYGTFRGFLDMDIFENGEQTRVTDRPDPIMDLIEMASYRWPHWLGWAGHDFVIPVHYEELRLRPWPTVQAIFEQIQPVSIPGPVWMLKNLHPHPTNPTFRKGLVGEWKRYFKPRHIAKAKRLMGDFMEEMGYTDWIVE